MKKKKNKKQSLIISYGILFILLFTLFIIYQQGQNNHYLNGHTLPQTTQHLKIHEKGIDVSVWQKNIDWHKVKNQGFSFAIIRTSYGWSKQNIDQRLTDHLQGAKKAGLKVGAYHYSYATTIEEAKKEAELFISTLEGTTWDFPVYFDMEDDCQLALSNQLRTQIAITFLETVKDAGYTVGLYANQHWLETKLDMSQLEQYEIWIASYTHTNKYAGKYGMWQYTSDGHIDGIEGRVDLNLLYKNY